MKYFVLTLPPIHFSDVILKVRQPLESEVELFQPGSTLISFLYPGQNKPLIEKLAERKINAFGKTLKSILSLFWLQSVYFVLF